MNYENENEWKLKIEIINNQQSNQSPTLIINQINHQEEEIKKEIKKEKEREREKWPDKKWKSKSNLMVTAIPRGKHHFSPDQWS